ncbi:MAG TPA: HAD family hydrolase [Balneolales bacterium]|nr:HAD family hydrolase [Balneolales bacterium]
MKQNHTVISVDFWNTLVKAETNGEKRHRVRMEALQIIARRYRPDITIKEIESAQEKVNQTYDKIWFEEHRTPSTFELISSLCREINITPAEQEVKDLSTIFQESIYDGPPDLADHVTEVIPELAEHYPMAIISDTMYSTGRVLREFLKERNLYDYFEVFVFSDETGYSKPNVKAFKTVLKETKANAKHSFHIGDIHNTDIIGAKNAGMKSILYTGASDVYKDVSNADYIVDNWLDIKALLLKT